MICTSIGWAYAEGRLNDDVNVECVLAGSGLSFAGVGVMFRVDRSLVCGSIASLEARQKETFIFRFFQSNTPSLAPYKY